jgi:hypothetical protein
MRYNLKDGVFLLKFSLVICLVKVLEDERAVYYDNIVSVY